LVAHTEVLTRRRTDISAAALLGLSTRQTRRLLTAYRHGGGGAPIHKASGRTSNNRLIPGIREYVIELVRSRFADFGPSMAAEVLFEKDGSQGLARDAAQVDSLGWVVAVTQAAKKLSSAALEA
jgi:hypothetical protein